MTTEQVKVSKVVIGELLRQESGMPTLEVSIDNKKGYLTPFRLYRFQVSGTFDGQNDMAGSPHINMRDIINHGSAGKSILKTYAEFAVMDFIMKYAKQQPARLWINEHIAINEFVEESIKWIKQNY